MRGFDLPSADGGPVRAAAVLLFAFACFQAAFLSPYMSLVPGERTNLFSPALMLLAALSLLGLPEVRRGPRPILEIAVWLALAGLLALSALHSSLPVPALCRVVAFWVPAVAGLCCAWALLRAERAVTLFLVFCTALFAGLTGLHLVFGPSVLGLHSHALAGLLLLLSAGPVFLFLSGGGLRRAWTLPLLGAGYLACFLAGSRFVVLLPLVLIPLFAVRNRCSRRVTLLALGVSLVLCLVYFQIYPRERLQLYNNESVFYRLEGYPAAWELIRQNPLLGIGVRTPRAELLQSFQPLWGIVSAPAYLAVVQRNITFDNQLLSLLVETGVPATLLYLGLLARLLLRYRRNIRAGRVPPAVEGALTFVLSASLIHFLICDGLYFPQTNWFFHVMLGLAAGGLATAAQAKES